MTDEIGRARYLAMDLRQAQIAGRRLTREEAAIVALAAAEVQSSMRADEAEKRAREKGLALVESALALRYARAHTIEACAKAVEMEDRAGRDWVPGTLWDRITREAAARVRGLNR